MQVGINHGLVVSGTAVAQTYAPADWSVPVDVGGGRVVLARVFPEPLAAADAGRAGRVAAAAMADHPVATAGVQGNCLAAAHAVLPEFALAERLLASDLRAQTAGAISARPGVLAAHGFAAAARFVDDGPFAEDLGRPSTVAVQPRLPRLGLPLPPTSTSHWHPAAALSPCDLDSTSRVISDQHRAAAPTSRDVERGSQAPSEVIDVSQTSFQSVEPVSLACSSDASTAGAEFLAGLTRPEGNPPGPQGNASTELVVNGVALRAYQDDQRGRFVR